MKKLLLLAGAVALPLLGEEFSARIVDGMGRPVFDATLEIKVPKKGADGKIQKTEWLKLSSDRNGVVKGSYDEKSLSADKSLSVYVSKEGYENYTTGLRPEYLLKRKFSPNDVRRIGKLAGEAQVSELKELLAGDFESEGKHKQESLEESVFYLERRLRPALRSLVADQDVGTAASVLLAFIGLPEDLRLIVKHVPRPKRELFKDRWAYGIVCALVEPSSNEEWDFLKKCALNEYDDLWVDAGAINTLRLIASPQSLGMLEEVRKKNTDRLRSIDEAVEYIKSKPSSLAATNLVEAAKKVAEAIKTGNWDGNREPRFNEEGDKASVDCEFIAGRDLLVYTATFHKMGDEWRFRGARETMQALLANPPDRKIFVGVWQGYSDSQLEFARMELRNDGSGLLAISGLPDSPPDNYRVMRWSQKRFKLNIEVEPVDPEAEPITLQNVTHGIASLELELHGKGWSRKMTLFNEAEFRERAKAVKKSLEDFQKSERR